MFKKICQKCKLYQLLKDLKFLQTLWHIITTLYITCKRTVYLMVGMVGQQAPQVGLVVTVVVGVSRRGDLLVSMMHSAASARLHLDHRCNTTTSKIKHTIRRKL